MSARAKSVVSFETAPGKQLRADLLVSCRGCTLPLTTLDTASGTSLRSPPQRYREVIEGV